MGLAAGGRIVSSPSIVGSALYIGCSDSNLYALHAQTGAILWRRKTGGRVESSPLVDHGKVYIGSHDGFIHVFDASTGDSLMAFPAGLQVSSPAIAAGEWLVSGVGPPGNSFTAFNRGNPDSAWSVHFRQFVYSSPAVFGSLVAISAGDGVLYCINMDLRKRTWYVPTLGGTYISTPAIRDSTVYFAPGDLDRNVYAVRLGNGATLWTSAGSAAIADQRRREEAAVDGALLASLRRMSPRLRAAWVGELAKRGNPTARRLALGKRATVAGSDFIINESGVLTSSVAVDGARVYVIQREQGQASDPDLSPLSRYTLLALNRTDGREAWRFTEVTGRSDAGYNASPIVAGGTLFAGWGDGVVRAFDAATGDTLWHDTLQGRIAASPAIAAGRVYFATVDGLVYGMRLGDTRMGLSFQQSTFCYPNPAQGNVSHIQAFVDKAADMTMTVYTMADQPVLRYGKRMAAQEKLRYDWGLDGVANGVYFARILVRYDDGRSERKTVKIAVLR